MAGVIDPNEPVVLQEMRRELRLRHKALETERAYVGWIERFMRHCGSKDLRQVGEREMREFLIRIVDVGRNMVLQVVAGTAQTR